MTIKSTEDIVVCILKRRTLKKNLWGVSDVLNKHSKWIDLLIKCLTSLSLLIGTFITLLAKYCLCMDFQALLPGRKNIHFSSLFQVNMFLSYVNDVSYSIHVKFSYHYCFTMKAVSYAFRFIGQARLWL